MSCCHLSGSCLGCNRRKRTHLLTSGSPCLCYSQSPHGWVLGQAGAPLPKWPGCSGPPRGSPLFPAHPNHYKQVNHFRHIRTYTRQLNIYRIIKRQGDVLYTTCTCIHFGYIFFLFFLKYMSFQWPSSNGANWFYYSPLPPIISMFKPKQPPMLATKTAHCFLASCTSTRGPPDMILRDTGGRRLKQRCLQRCTMFSRPAQEFFTKPRKGLSWRGKCP